MERTLDHYIYHENKSDQEPIFDYYLELRVPAYIRCACILERSKEPYLLD